MSLVTSDFLDALWVSQVALVVNNPPANVEEARDVGLIPGSGRSSGVGHGSSLQYFCLENPMEEPGRSLVGYSPWGCKESNTTERLSTNTQALSSHFRKQA